MSDAPSRFPSGASILAADQLAAIEHHLHKVGNVAVLWWHLWGARAPTPLAFDDYETFLEFLKSQPRVGDAIDVWAFPNDQSTRIAGGKLPDEHGNIIKGGAY
jgi:hypothetical protein